MSAFIIVVLEEALRQISYLKYSPFLGETNIYVALASGWMPPYIASTIIFITVCAIIFAVTKLTSNNPSKERNPQTELLRKIVPIGVYIIVIAMYIPPIVQWVFLLT